MDSLWLIPLLPALGAAVNGLVGIRLFAKRTAGAVAVAAMAAAFGLSVLAFVRLLQLPAGVHEINQVLVDWLPAMPLATHDGPSGILAVPWGFRLDPLSAVMLLVVTGIGTIIHVYSTAYMAHEPRGGVARFFCYLNLFCFFMLTLVLGNNFLVMFVGWEGVGLCSYLLIGYWYGKTPASDAGRKAFVTNRIGDWAFLLGVFLIFFTFGTLDFRAVQEAAAAMPVEAAGWGVLSTIALLLFVGATGKSAQIPLFVWLPDAMEGPTPVSALIHAATMVTAGVYMVGRNAVLFSQAPMVMDTVAVVGVLTALMAATIALVQTDIKRVLAYSTVSQLGYMFAAMGVGAFAAGTFHLLTHAFFKALLFLGSGSVIHALAGEQDMRRMGGLRRRLPITYATMLVGTLAIAGVPPLSGFFSKDEILFRAFLENRIVWALAALTALLTAFYMFRLMAMTFFGGGRGATADAGSGRPGESPAAMTGPLIALAAGAVLAGFIGIPGALGGGNAIEHFLEPSFSASLPVVPPAAAGPDASAGHAAGGAPASDGLALGLMLFSVAVAGLGIAGAYRVYVQRPGLAAVLAERFAAPHRLLTHQYYVDALYDATVVNGTRATGRALAAVDRRVVDGTVAGASRLTVLGAWVASLTDRTLVDGLVNLLGWVSQEGSFGFRRLQTGLVQNYALLMLVGIVLFVGVYLVVR